MTTPPRTTKTTLRRSRMPHPVAPYPSEIKMTAAYRKSMKE
jgi:hypothetical protein